MARLTGAQAQLLRDVAKDFLLEPRRLDMSDWGYKEKEEDGGPPCGTAVCLAGRLRIRHFKPNTLLHMSNARLNVLMNDARDFAIRKLGLTELEAWALFLVNSAGGYTGWPEWFRKAYLASPPRSYERAGVVADRVEHFIEHGV